MSKPKKTNKKKDLIDYIKKSHIKALQKFNEELKAWAKETGEDANTCFTLCDIAVSDDGQMFYTYDGQIEFEVIVRYDEEEKCYYEDEGPEGIMEYVKFWRKCLKRAKKYFDMDPERLDAIQDGEIEDDEEEED